MNIILIVVSLIIIILALLQSSKAEAAANIIQGGNKDLFSNRKERGGELFISRLTFAMGFILFFLCILMTI